MYRDQFDDEEAYFRAELAKESQREAEQQEQKNRRRGVLESLRAAASMTSSCAGMTTRALGSVVSSATRSCIRRPAPTLESMSSESMTVADAATSSSQQRRWYTRCFALPTSSCSCFSCCRRAPISASASTAYSVLNSDGTAPAPSAVSASDDAHLADLEMQPLDSSTAATSTNSKFTTPGKSSTISPPPATISSLPVLPSVEKQRTATKPTIDAPKHEIANPALFSRTPAAAATTALTTSLLDDASLTIPVDAQRRLELELQDFYSDMNGADESGPIASDDALSDDEVPEELLGASSDDDPLGIGLYASERMQRPIDETPAERRKREALLAQKRQAREEELRRKELPKEMPMPPSQPIKPANLAPSATRSQLTSTAPSTAPTTSTPTAPTVASSSAVVPPTSGPSAPVAVASSTPAVATIQVAASPVSTTDVTPSTPTPAPENTPAVTSAASTPTHSHKPDSTPHEVSSSPTEQPVESSPTMTNGVHPKEIQSTTPTNETATTEESHPPTEVDSAPTTNSAAIPSPSLDEEEAILKESEALLQSASPDAPATTLKRPVDEEEIDEDALIAELEQLSE